MGASGVGLFRTEYLFLTHPDVPDEEEQVEAYRQIIEASPNQQHHHSHAGSRRRQNHSLLRARQRGQSVSGWRSIRLSFEHPEFFATQIRAVLRAAAAPESRVRLMFPMITTLEEIRRVRKMVARACDDLKKHGKPCGNVQIGLMIEVPAAAIMIDSCWKWSISCRSAPTTWCSI